MRRTRSIRIDTFNRHITISESAHNVLTAGVTLPLFTTPDVHMMSSCLTYVCSETGSQYAAPQTLSFGLARLV